MLLVNGVVGAELAPTMELVRQRLASGEPTRIVCFGDSITGAYYHTGGQRAWCDMLGIALQRVFPNAQVTMVNAGISGQTTADGLARIQKDVLDKTPHLVVVMFGMNDVISYSEHQDLSYYLEPNGSRHLIRSDADWQMRRRHLLNNLQRVMGPLPGASFRVPLVMTAFEEVREAKFVRRRISFQSDPFDRVTAWLLLPSATDHKPRPAVLCLHQTTGEGKNEPTGLAGSPNMHYGRELAERGYVVLAPDYPSLGEHAYDFAQHPEFVSGSMKLHFLKNDLPLCRHFQQPLI